MQLNGAQFNDFFTLKGLLMMGRKWQFTRCKNIVLNVFPKYPWSQKHHKRVKIHNNHMLVH